MSRAAADFAPIGPQTQCPNELGTTTGVSAVVTEHSLWRRASGAPALGHHPAPLDLELMSGEDATRSWIGRTTCSPPLDHELSSSSRLGSANLGTAVTAAREASSR